MTPRSLAGILLLVVSFTGCGPNLDRARSQGAEAGESAGTRAGRDLAAHLGQERGAADGDSAARFDTSHGRVPEIYVRPFAAAILFGLLLGLFGQYAIVHRIARGGAPSSLLVSVVPDLAASAVYQVWQTCTAMEAIAAARLRTVTLEAAARRRAADEIHHLTLAKMRRAAALRFEHGSRIIEEFETETANIIAQARRRAARIAK